MKKKLLFLNYLIWRPDEPNFKHRFEKLSRYHEGSILHLGTGRKVVAGSFDFISTSWNTNVILRQLKYIGFCLVTAKKKKNVAAIVSYDPLICGLTGVIVKKITGSKLVIEVNTDHFDAMADSSNDFKKSIAKVIKAACLRISFRFADGIKFINTPLAEKYTDIFSLKKKRIVCRVFFSFIATHVFHKQTSRNNGPILFVGHPYDVKGVDVLLKAFNIISSEYPEVTLKIIGHCEHRKPYERLAGGNRRVSFHKGMFFNEIISEFENCRFLVLPSRSESMGRVLVEAMACGKAVIGSRVGGIPEIIEENKTGLLFESENYHELADKMRMLLDDPALMKHIGDAGYLRAKNHFSPIRYAWLYNDFVKAVLNNNQGSPKK